MEADSRHRPDEAEELHVRYERILREHLHGYSDELSNSSRLTDLGVDSLAVVQLLINIEDAFEIFFPDELVTAQTFNTVGSLRAVIESLADGEERVGRRGHSGA